MWLLAFLCLFVCSLAGYVHHPSPLTASYTFQFTSSPLSIATPPSAQYDERAAVPTSSFKLRWHGGSECVNPKTRIISYLDIFHVCQTFMSK